jgi:drug/metabolite transporter (DMT)-like permease
VFKNSRSNALALLHFVVLLFGFTGILGKLISISSLDLVFYRMAIAVVALFLFCWITKRLVLTKKHFVYLLGIGIIVALHWVAFFESIKLTNVSMALACLSSASFFTAVLEPIFLKKKINLVDLLLGIFVIIGVSLMFKVEAGNALGIVVALVSAFLAALFTVLNAKAIHYAPPSTVSLVEMLGGLLCVSAILLVLKGDLPALPNLSDTVWLLILGVLCTAFAFVASVRVMQHLSPFTVALSVNLEPIYAIILAFIIFNEHQELGPTFYVGASLIFLSVFAKPVFNFVTKSKKISV